ncbi:MAG TPA: hypothetical protein GXX56_04425 [Rhodocyclaceae bacterium]|nr:hypothetical protein [Rhodocyclaceae bacterium]
MNKLGKGFQLSDFVMNKQASRFYSACLAGAGVAFYMGGRKKKRESRRSWILTREQKVIHSLWK